MGFAVQSLALSARLPLSAPRPLPLLSAGAPVGSGLRTDGRGELLSKESGHCDGGFSGGGRGVFGLVGAAWGARRVVAGEV